jgi:hypothetical protein
MKKVIALLSATVWIGISEFIRNQFLLKQLWIDHYKSLGLVFPLEPLNGAVWGIWSVMFAVLIFILAQKFSLIQTALISWFAAFVMMWVTIGNLMVLPVGILWYAVPLSLLESFLAAWIIKKIDK